MRVLGIDPGPARSAYVIWDGKTIEDKGLIANEEFLCKILDREYDAIIEVIVEQVACYGMPVGKDIFDTVFFTGRIFQSMIALSPLSNVVCVVRREIKLHFCNSVKAKDSNIRQALIDRLGKPGVKKNPGVTYGIKKDMWSALALAVYRYDVLDKR